MNSTMSFRERARVRFGTTIQTIAGHISNGPNPGFKTEQSKQNKEEEAERLEQFTFLNNLWITDIDFTLYVSEGAEQKVYLNGSNHVLKLNDAIYYLSWKDYFYNLLLHNYFFPDTAYELVGFTKHGNVLYCVVKQHYVSISEMTDLNLVKDFLALNGFENIRNNDYHNPQLGIILEDLHDENVLTRNGILYFIDTVFYLTENFWKEH